MNPYRPPLKPGDVYPAHILRDEYGFNAENRPIITVNPIEVPAHLLSLIPYAERWAIPCDVARGDYFSKQPEEDIAQFYCAVKPFERAINAWLDSLSNNVLDWPKAGIHFMYLLKAYSEAYQPTAEELAQREMRFLEMQSRMQRKLDIEEATNCFRLKKFENAAELFSRHEDSLTNTDRAKLAYARGKETKS